MRACLNNHIYYQVLKVVQTKWCHFLRNKHTVNQVEIIFGGSNSYSVQQQITLVPRDLNIFDRLIFLEKESTLKTYGKVFILVSNCLTKVDRHGESNKQLGCRFLSPSDHVGTRLGNTEGSRLPLHLYEQCTSIEYIEYNNGTCDLIIVDITGCFPRRLKVMLGTIYESYMQ